MIKLDKILMPTDFSPPSENAMRYAVLFAKEYDAEVIVLHVISKSLHLSRTKSELSEEEIENIYVEMSEAVQKALVQFIDKFSDGFRVRTLIKRGIPTVEIVAAAKTEDVDLIVMGTHGQTGIRHSLIGSVAERVVRNAHCPVFTVKPVDFEFEMPE